MRTWKQVVAHLAWSGVVISGLPAGSLVACAQQQASSPTMVEPARLDDAQAKLEDLPDSPGATLSQSQNQTPASSSQPGGAQPANAQQPATPPPAAAPAVQAPSTPAPAQRPVGTAAAETPVVSGVAASQPAGVAIAPAKQRRVRTLVLRMGAIVGAGVAVGTVVALTAATPSKPPGVH